MATTSIGEEVGTVRIEGAGVQTWDVISISADTSNQEGKVRISLISQGDPKSRQQIKDLLLSRRTVELIKQVGAVDPNDFRRLWLHSQMRQLLDAAAESGHQFVCDKAVEAYAGVDSLLVTTAPDEPF